MSRLHHKIVETDHFTGTLANNQTTAAFNITRHQHTAVIIETAALTTGLQLMVSNDGTNFYYYESIALFEFDPTNHGGKYHSVTHITNFPFKFIQIHSTHSFKLTHSFKTKHQIKSTQPLTPIQAFKRMRSSRSMRSFKFMRSFNPMRSFKSTLPFKPMHPFKLMHRFKPIPPTKSIPSTKSIHSLTPSAVQIQSPCQTQSLN